MTFYWRCTHVYTREGKRPNIGGDDLRRFEKVSSAFG